MKKIDKIVDNMTLEEIDKRMQADEMNTCCKCKSDYEEEYYKYNNDLYCFDCLTEELESENRLQIVKTTHYYDDDWGELGTDDEINEVVQNLCENYDIEVVE